VRWWPVIISLFLIEYLIHCFIKGTSFSIVIINRSYNKNYFFIIMLRRGIVDAIYNKGVHFGMVVAANETPSFFVFLVEKSHPTRGLSAVPCDDALPVVSEDGSNSVGYHSSTFGHCIIDNHHVLLTTSTTD
jgi:hypothetical protein